MMYCTITAPVVLPKATSAAKQGRPPPVSPDVVQSGAVITIYPFLFDCFLLYPTPSPHQCQFPSPVNT